MRNVFEKVRAFVRDEDGLTMVEYAVAGSLITATVAGAFLALGGAVELKIEEITRHVGAPAAP